MRDRVAEGRILKVAVKLRVDVFMRGGEVRTFERLAKLVERSDLIAGSEMTELHDGGNRRGGDHCERRTRRQCIYELQRHNVASSLTVIGTTLSRPTLSALGRATADR